MPNTLPLQALQGKEEVDWFYHHSSVLPISRTPKRSKLINWYTYRTFSVKRYCTFGMTCCVSPKQIKWNKDSLKNVATTCSEKVFSTNTMTLRRYIYVFLIVCVYVYLHVYRCVYVCLCILMYICVCAFMCIYMYMCIYVCLCVVCVYRYTCICVFMCICKHCVCVYVYMCVYMYICMLWPFHNFRN